MVIIRYSFIYTNYLVSVKSQIVGKTVSLNSPLEAVSSVHDVAYCRNRQTHVQTVQLHRVNMTVYQFYHSQSRLIEIPTGISPKLFRPISKLSIKHLYSLLSDEKIFKRINHLDHEDDKPSSELNDWCNTITKNIFSSMNQ